MTEVDALYFEDEEQRVRAHMGRNDRRCRSLPLPRTPTEPRKHGDMDDEIPQCGHDADMKPQPKVAQA
jgi:hypothetical protein